jgi:hypothetical protein
MNKTERYQGNDIDAHEGGRGDCLASGSGIVVVRGRSVQVRKVDAVHCIHLAVKWRRNKKTDHVQDYDHEGGMSRKGVNLSKGQIHIRASAGSGNSKWGPIVTYPYGPPIALMSPDEIPLVVKTGGVFPAVSWRDDLSHLIFRKAAVVAVPHVNTCHEEPNLHEYHCQKTCSVGLRSR